MEISADDLRAMYANEALVAMKKFWNACPVKTAVRWIEDTDGAVIVFTRGEYKDAMMDAVLLKDGGRGEVVTEIFGPGQDSDD